MMWRRSFWKSIYFVCIYVDINSNAHLTEAYLFDTEAEPSLVNMGFLLVV